MIAGCPKCGARYRVEREKLAQGGVRLRCSKCEAVFRVRAPEEAPAQAETRVSQASLAPEPAPLAAPVSEPAAAPPARAPAPPPREPAVGAVVVVAIPEHDVAKRVGDALEARGLRAVVVHDGVEAILEIQRKLPRAVVVAAHLPKMFGFQVCELVKRNESLRGTWVVLVGAIHKEERYRRPAGDTYGADAYLEAPDLPEGVLPLLERAGIELAAPPPPPRAAFAPQPPATEPARPRPRPAAVAAPPTPAPARPVAKPAVSAAPAPRASDGLDEQRAKAERLARIIVSDIVLYNEPKFAEAVRRGSVLEALDADLSEGRHLFQERIDARVRGERDYLSEELLRVARQRGMK